MAKTTSIYARVEPEIKEQAEKVLSQLGIPVSSAISMFLRQVVIKRGIPFDVTLPENIPVNLSSLTDEEFDAEIEKGMNDIISGRVLSAKTVMDNMSREYGI
ncbi:MAG: type II toxin-antitoxin system RelB/DinJ family antitoxin [Clostridia bacterium]|nr:type II toxin-antitoxin system RelB/DinJ family antitoxin [Clostridia bacterium]